MLAAWNSFYVMMGSSAAALTGLLFIVITLATDPRRATSEEGISTFTTPNVVHFSCALLTSALMAVPFRSLEPIAISLGIVGAGGLFYVLGVAIRASRLRSYRPDAEDWAFNTLLPCLAYVTLIGGALAMHGTAPQALYAPAAAVTLLIFVGIHNAWDVVTFLATGKAESLIDRAPNGVGEKKSD